MHAVIRTGGKQYRVAAEDVIKVEKLTGDAGDMVVFDQVLAVGDGDATEVGAPLVDGASVAARVIAQDRAEKIIVFKKKRRQGYRRRKGHRQDLTVLRIEEILTGGKKPSGKAKAAPKKAEVKKQDGAEKQDDKAEAAATDQTAGAKAPKEAAEKPAPEKQGDAPAAAGDAPRFTAPEGEADDLKKIGGVGKVLEGKLNDLGITTFAQIAAFTEEDIAYVDEVLNFKGRIQRENWVDQAKELAGG